MKKFLALFATASFAVVGLTNCGGGDQGSPDADGDGIISVSEFANGCGFQFDQATPPITLEKAKQYFNEEAYNLPELSKDAVYIIQDRYLRLQDSSRVQTRVTYVKLTDTTYQMIFAFFAKDSSNTTLAQALGLGDAELTASKITCTIDFAASPSTATWELEAQVPEPEEGDNQQPVAGTGRGTEYATYF